jgi:hypothetical protein
VLALSCGLNIRSSIRLGLRLCADRGARLASDVCDWAGLHFGLINGGHLAAGE